MQKAMVTISPETAHNLKLTSAEIANIWTNYQNDTMAICTLSSFLQHVDDPDIRSVVELSLKQSRMHIEKLEAFFTKDHLPIPVGFSEKYDLNIEAPRLFTDDFYLFYVENIGKLGAVAYTLALSNSARPDMCQYYTECLSESAQLLNKAMETMLKKGTFIRSPYIPEYKEVEFVKKESYIQGLLGGHRPLNVLDMTNIYFNLIQNQLGRTLLMGFSQVARSQQVRDYLVRGRNIADKHVEIFGSTLSKEYLPSASTWDVLPTASKIAPVSDKIMMFHVSMLNSAGIGHYGQSLGLGPRRDLGAIYVRLMMEIMAYADDGADIMIDNGWMEQPPQAVDRDKLAKG
ncbi:DUF3231 family protein [Paenibacillus eucommiae]|uniref:DUF3231 family protein n=1 Tax=Paenibacillus eucommiae TaxID=1355755 RepID=A0ABS4IR32_9BACL|nr:DUF3231 family protein [Paenibacillus eucommiae]MBP1990022.1 hypothetical protein [Paenibacillus eucommiae]